MVLIAASDDVLDDDAIDALLESIHLPDGTGQDDKPAAEEPDTKAPAAETPAREIFPAEKPENE